jgi:hypothetical protein
LRGQELQFEVADLGVPDRCVKPALRCPTLRPGARKRGLHRPRPISASFLAVAVVLEDLQRVKFAFRRRNLLLALVFRKSQPKHTRKLASFGDELVTSSNPRPDAPLRIALTESCWLPVVDDGLGEVICCRRKPQG